MEKQGRLSFSITTQRRRLIIKPPACLAAAADEGSTRSRSTPAPQFITEFGPSQTTAAPAAAPAIVIAPLPNSHLFKPAIIEQGIVFAREEPGDNPRCSTHAAYGLNLPTTDKNKAPPSRLQVTSSSELLRRRFKQDIAALSDDHSGTGECPKLSAEGFAAAVLAGYGWSEGQGIGRNHRKKGDAEVFSCGRRPGTGAQRQTFGLGYNPEICGAGKKRKRQNTREQERVSSVRPRTG